MTFYIFKSYLALRMAPSLISIIMYGLNMMRRVCLEAWNTRFTNKRRFKVKRIFLAVSQVLRLHWERITEADSRSEGNYLKRECRLYSRCFLTFFVFERRTLSSLQTVMLVNLTFDKSHITLIWCGSWTIRSQIFRVLIHSEGYCHN